MLNKNKSNRFLGENPFAFLKFFTFISTGRWYNFLFFLDMIFVLSRTLKTVSRKSSVYDGLSLWFSIGMVRNIHRLYFFSCPDAHLGLLNVFYLKFLFRTFNSYFEKTCFFSEPAHFSLFFCWQEFLSSDDLLMRWISTFSGFESNQRISILGTMNWGYDTKLNTREGFFTDAIKPKSVLQICYFLRNVDDTKILK